MPEFTKDFFTKNIDNFKRVLEILGGVEHALEIGSYQGRSACWMLQHMITDTGTLICVDPFTHQDLEPWSWDFPHQNNADIAARFWRNINEHKKPHQCIELMTSRSYPALAELITRKQRFDFIYVDGNHSAATVLADACMAFGLTRVGGIILFDDYFNYFFDAGPARTLDHCKISIDAFVNLFADYITPIVSNNQIGVQRIR